MRLESSAFKNNQSIPSKYTCDGNDVNPPLVIVGVPEDAESLVIIVEDPDAPSGRFIHWSAWNIPPETTAIEEDGIPEDAIEGLNDFGETGYAGPCPPDREHRYCFKIFALDAKLNLNEGASIDMLENAIEHHVLDEAELVGKYERR